MLVTDLSNINPGLENIKMALSLIANPQDSFKSIQIAGTNGKGSVATWLELMFLSFLKKLEVLDSSDADDFLKNRKVGKYTSPHLISVTERVAVNGNNIVEDEFHNLFFELFGESFNADVEDISNHKAFPAESKHQKIYSSPPLSSQKLGFNLSYFEKLTILAFEYFKRQNVDLAILEVGMGGRWDATNVILPERTLATVITSIGLDHQEFLGDTLDKIAKEKEAIIKPNVQHFDFRDLRSGQEFSPNDENGSNFVLAKKVYETITDELLSHQEIVALQNAFKNRWLGRFSYDESRNVVVDGAHNPEAALKLKTFLDKLEYKKPKIYIFAFLDKDFRTFLENLNLDDNDLVIVTELDCDRATKKEKVQEVLKELYPNNKSIIYDDFNEAYKAASVLRSSEELIVICGSLYLVGKYYQAA